MVPRYIFGTIASRTKDVHSCSMSNDDRVQYKFLIPADLKDRIHAAAKANYRSMTAEITAALEEKYPAPVIEEEPFELTPLERDGFMEIVSSIVNSPTLSKPIKPDLEKVRPYLERLEAELARRKDDPDGPVKQEIQLSWEAFKRLMKPAD